MTNSSASLITSPLFYETDQNNNPLAGGNVYSYQAGTLIPLTTYTDATLTVPNTNPVILDAYGKAQIWLGPYTYKLNVTDVNNVQHPDYPVDNLQSIQTTTSNAANAATAAVLAQLASPASGQGAALVGDIGPLSNEVASTQHQINSYFGMTSVFRFFTATQISDVLAGTLTQDVTTALNLALASVGTFNGTLFLPAGKYKISGTLIIPTQIKIQGSTDGNLFSASPVVVGTVLVAASTFTTGSMVTMLNTQGVVWDGVSLLGTFTTPGGSSGVQGFTVNSGAGYQNSQRNHFRNFAVSNCYIAMAFDNDSGYQDAGNTDGWVVERFSILNCQHGIVTNSDNVAYSEIRNGSISTNGNGIWPKRAWEIKISSVAGANWGTSVLSSSNLFLITANSGNIMVENCQAQGNANYCFATFYDAVAKTTPTLLISNAINAPIYVSSEQDHLLFMSNVWAYPLYITGNNSTILGLADEYVAGAVITGTGNQYQRKTADKVGSFVPTLWQGSTQIPSLALATGYYAWQGTMCWIYINCYKGSGAPSASGQWTIKGIPYPSVVPGSGFTPLQTSLVCDSLNLNGTEVATLSPTWFKFDSTGTFLQCIGQQASTSWSSGLINIELQGTFCPQ